MFRYVGNPKESTPHSLKHNKPGISAKCALLLVTRSDPVHPLTQGFTSSLSFIFYNAQASEEEKKPLIDLQCRDRFCAVDFDCWQVYLRHNVCKKQTRAASTVEPITAVTDLKILSEEWETSELSGIVQWNPFPLKGDTGERSPKMWKYRQFPVLQPRESCC